MCALRLWLLQNTRQFLICGQCVGRVEPAEVLGLLAQLAGGAPTYEARASNLPVRLSLAHAHQNVTVVIHLKPPIGHVYLRGKSRDDRPLN